MASGYTLLLHLSIILLSSPPLLFLSLAPEGAEQSLIFIYFLVCHRDNRSPQKSSQCNYVCCAGLGLYIVGDDNLVKLASLTSNTCLSSAA